MKNLLHVVFILFIWIFTQACRQKPGKNYNQETSVDQDGISFIKNGIEGGLTEIKASGLALTKSNNQRVIRFAKMMVDDHTKAGNELMKIESDKLVLEKDLINSNHQIVLSQLSQKSGSAFDKAYLQMMIVDHENTIKLFDGASRNTDVRISKFAVQTLPSIKMHLDSAKAINATLQ